jgi:predicted AAA+ superfamily ATPase
MSKLKEIGKLKLEAQNPENVRGVVRFWQVQSAAEISEDNWEKDTEQVFEKTYITEQLMQTIKRITDSVNGEREKSAFVFEGTYGTGKSHSMLTIYHIFKHPELAKDYFPSLKELEIPKIDHIIILSHYRNEKNLWEPLYESIAPEQKQLIQDYPAIENLISLLKNKKVLVFLDETENWFATRSDEILIQRNLNFLQNLFEAVSGRDSQTAVIQTVLGRDNRLKNIINRNSETINLNIKDIERKQIISHRLFETLNKEKRQQTIGVR